MKKLIKILAMFAMASCVFASCEKTAGDAENEGNGNNDGGIIDDGGSSVQLPAALTGSDYYVFFLGESEYKAIEKKVSANLMPNSSNVFVDVWQTGETYTGAETVGLNSFGFGEGWLAFAVNTGTTWSGGAISTRPSEDGTVALPAADLSKIMDNPSEWYFHFALKSDVAGESHVIDLYWGDQENGGSHYPVVAGANPGDFTDGVTTYPVPVSGEYKVGEWNEYEIPISQTGLNFNLPIAAGNLVAFLSGGTAGKTLNLDAVFIYKK